MPDYVQTKAQLLARLNGNQPTTLLLRDLIETLFTEAADPVAAIEAVVGANGVNIQTIPRSTTVALEAVANAINTTGKFAEKAVINTTTGLIVTANTSAAAGVWLALDGTTAHTPV